MSSVSILELASMARAFGALTQSGPPPALYDLKDVIAARQPA